MPEIPRHRLTRGARLAGLPLGHAARAAWGAGRRIGGRPAELVADELSERTAERLFSVLGELKGGAMKLGQAMSVMEAALPEEVAGPYRATLTKLQESAPAMPTATVHRVMTEELGEDWRDRFAYFDDEPAAAASIGQVHRAIARDGREVAVKIQYPGAADALKSDLAQLSRMGRLFASGIPGLEIKPLLAEISARVSEELDYLRESQSQRDFAVAFEGDPDIVVPHVLAAGPRVLVSEWVDGRPLSDIIANGTGAERDRAGLLYQRFLLSSPKRVGLLHADPHPGNYRITAEDKLAVLDYGAVARLPDGIPAAIGRLLTVALVEDEDAVHRVLVEEGFIRSGVQVDARAVLNYLLPFAEPLRQDEFHYSREWMRHQFRRIKDPRGSDFSVGMRLNLPPKYLLVHRVWIGATGVSCQLDATVPMRAEVARWLPGFTAADPAQ